MGQQVCGSLGTGAPGLPSPSPCPAPSPPLHPESPCGPWGPVGQQGLSSVLSPSLHPSRSLWRTARRTRVLCFGGFSYSCGSPGVPPSWSGQPRSWSLICDRAPPKGSLSCARYHPLTSPPEDPTALSSQHPSLRGQGPVALWPQEGPCGRFREKRCPLRIKHGKPFSAELKLSCSHTKSNKNNNGQLLVFFCEPGPGYGVPVLCHRASRLDGRPGSCRRLSL